MQGSIRPDSRWLGILALTVFTLYVAWIAEQAFHDLWSEPFFRHLVMIGCRLVFFLLFVWAVTYINLYQDRSKGA